MKASEDELAGIHFRYFRETRENVAPLDLRLMAKFMRGLGQRHRLFADAFNTYADILILPSRDEALVLATFHRLLVEERGDTDFGCVALTGLTGAGRFRSDSDPGCVKPSFNSVVEVNLPEFQELQPAKLLISLIPKFQRMSQNHSSGDTSTFLYSLDPFRTLAAHGHWPDRAFPSQPILP